MSQTSLNDLKGWAIQDWSLLPRELFVLKLGNFQEALETAPRWASVFFMRPRRVCFRGIKQERRQPIEVVSSDFNPGSSTHEITTTGNGSISVIAQDISTVLF